MSVASERQCSELFAEHHDRLLRYARHLVHDDDDADDVVQDAFERAHIHLRNGNTIRAPLSFFFVTIRNLVYDRHRGKTDPLAHAVDEDVVEISDGDGESSVERQQLSDEELRMLQHAVNQLPKRMREAFILRKVHGYSCREIAEEQGRSLNTVRNQIAQGFLRVLARQSILMESAPLNGYRRVNGRASDKG